LKIDDSLHGVPPLRGRDTRKGKAADAPAAANPGAVGDSIEITPTSSQLNKLEEDLGRIDSADTGKIEAIRQAIAEGTFQVDEEAVADALVKTTIEQLRRQRG
jgi:negative regulator of flagellin synthesis FlgM